MEAYLQPLASWSFYTAIIKQKDPSKNNPYLFIIL